MTFLQLENQIKDLNGQLEKRSQQRLAISVETKDSPVIASQSNAIDRDISPMHLGHKDMYKITIDPCSDSGFVRSSRFSVSDQDLEFL